MCLKEKLFLHVYVHSSPKVANGLHSCSTGPPKVQYYQAERVPIITYYSGNVHNLVSKLVNSPPAYVQGQ